MPDSFLALPSPAKVNLFLRILNQRPDGYHNLQTAFQFVDLSDPMTFCCRQDGEIELKTPLLGINGTNLALQAAQLLQHTTGCQLGADITIQKNIPMGAGLGGGSSNAATTLIALNHLWHLKLTHDELIPLGTQLGADVPIFLFGHAAWAEGIGEQLSPIILPEPWYLLVTPPLVVSTQDIFQHPNLPRDQTPYNQDSFNWEQTCNDCEALVRKKYPPIDSVFNALAPHTRPRLTGTGATVYATFDSRQEASRIAAHAPERCQTIIARGLNKSPAYGALTQ